jgi:HK97 family phage portal protein
VPSWDPQKPWLAVRVSLVFSCVDRVSTALASMPLRVSKDSVPQEPKPWMVNPDHERYSHIGDAITEIVFSLLIHGNAFLWPTDRYADGYPSSWVVVDPGIVSWDDAEKVWRLTAAGQQLQARPGDLVHIRYASRPGRRLGISPLQAAAANLVAVEGYEHLAGKLAANSGLPTQGILSTDMDIPEDTARRYKEKWQARGDGDIAVLGSGLRYESLTLNPRDLALLELREFDGRQIAAAFGVPPFMVNLAAGGDLTYSTTQGMMDFFWRSTLKPLATNIGRALGTMLPDQWTTVRFDADEYTRGTIAEHTASVVAASGGPVITRDEARLSLGLSPQGLDSEVFGSEVQRV